MTVTHTFVARRSSGRFHLTATASTKILGGPYLELVVEDAESGALLRLVRPELMPLLAVVKEALKEVEDAAEGLPSDPVERASTRVPHLGFPTSMQRAHILKAYRQEMAELQERFICRFDAAAERIRTARGSGGQGNES